MSRQLANTAERAFFESCGGRTNPSGNFFIIKPSPKFPSINLNEHFIFSDANILRAASSSPLDSAAIKISAPSAFQSASLLKKSARVRDSELKRSTPISSSNAKFEYADISSHANSLRCAPANDSPATSIAETAQKLSPVVFCLSKAF